MTCLMAKLRNGSTGSDRRNGKRGDRRGLADLREHIDRRGAHVRLGFRFEQRDQHLGGVGGGLIAQQIAGQQPNVRVGIAQQRPQVRPGGARHHSQRIQRARAQVRVVGSQMRQNRERALWRRDDREAGKDRLAHPRVLFQLERLRQQGRACWRLCDRARGRPAVLRRTAQQRDPGVVRGASEARLVRVAADQRHRRAPVVGVPRRSS